MITPAFEEILLKPQPGGGLTSAETKHRYPFGWIESSWTLAGDVFEHKVKVPLNSSATVELPNGDTHSVGSGSYTYTVELE